MIVGMISIEYIQYQSIGIQMQRRRPNYPRQFKLADFQWTGINSRWIVSLCPLQENVADRMDMIYSNAFVDFAAHGPKLGSKRYQYSQPIWNPNRPEDVAVLCRQKIYHRNLLSAPSTTSFWF